jgi:type II secretory pathway component PulF
MKKLFTQRWKRKWKRREIILLLEQLGLYTSAGLTLDRSLRIVGEHSVGHRKKHVMSMIMAVEAGTLFSRVFSQYITANGSVIGMIQQGEQSGELGKAFQSAHLLLEKSDELTKKCFSALAYPIVIGIFAVLLTIGLVRGVMPQIIPLLMSMHVKLPLLTRIVIATSQGLISYSIYVTLGGLLGVVLARILYKRFFSIKKAAHASILLIPLIGSSLRTYWQAMFFRSCGSLIESGLSAAQSYGSACGSIPLIPLRYHFELHLPGLTQGTPMSHIFREHQALSMPSFVPPLVYAGESSGSLGLSCIRVADILDRNLEHSLKRMTSLIEPLMMIFMGCTVGAIALSIMLPIYDISKVLQR